MVVTRSATERDVRFVTLGDFLTDVSRERLVVLFIIRKGRAEFGSSPWVPKSAG